MKQVLRFNAKQEKRFNAKQEKCIILKLSSQHKIQATLGTYYSFIVRVILCSKHNSCQHTISRLERSETNKYTSLVHITKQ